MMERKISNCELLSMNQEIPNTKLIKGTKITEQSPKSVLRKIKCNG